MFKEHLLHIEKEIKNVENTDVFTEAVKTKLDNSLDRYVENLEETTQYLLSRDTQSLITYFSKKR